MAAAPTAVMVLADANVLVKDVVSASLFDLNKAGLIDLRWTPEIEAEYITHRARLRAEREGGDTRPEDLQWAAKRIELNKKHLVPNANPPCWVGESTLEILMADPKYAGLQGITDPDDIHVAMAAALMASQSKTTVILATHDLGDLPQSALEPFNVVVLHPGILLEMLYLKSPKAVAASLLITCGDFSEPDITPKDFLRSISGKNQFDNPELAKLLEIEWNLTQAANQGPGLEP